MRDSTTPSRTQACLKQRPQRLLSRQLHSAVLGAALGVQRALHHRRKGALPQGPHLPARVRLIKGPCNILSFQPVQRRSGHCSKCPPDVRALHNYRRSAIHRDNCARRAMLRQTQKGDAPPAVLGVHAGVVQLSGTGYCIGKDGMHSSGHVPHPLQVSCAVHGEQGTWLTRPSPTSANRSTRWQCQDMVGQQLKEADALCRS